MKIALIPGAVFFLSGYLPAGYKWYVYKQNVPKYSKHTLSNIHRHNKKLPEGTRVEQFSVQKKWMSFSLSMSLAEEKLLILGVRVGQRNGAKGCRVALHIQMGLQVSHPQL